MAIARVGSVDVGYAADGEGDPFLLFHGTTMDRAAWDLVLPGVTDPYTWVKVEFPGSGESPMPTAPLSVDGLVEQALGVMDHLGHERFHVAGYSLGAVVAAATAALAPTRVRSATLLAGWAATDARQRVTFDLWRRLIATDKELFMRYAVADGFTADGIAMLEPMLEAMVPMMASAIAPGSDAHLDLDIRVDISALLTAITAPTLVISGTEDRWVGVEHGRTLAAAIVGARFEELPAGHLVIQEKAAEVAGLMAAHAAAAP